MKPSKVLAMSQGIRAKAWTNFQIKPPVPTVDPNLPPMYRFDVQGQRGDGMVFTVPVYVNKQKVEMLPAIKAMEVLTGLLGDGIKQLMTFTGCECGMEHECDVHTTNVSVH